MRERREIESIRQLLDEGQEEEEGRNGAGGRMNNGKGGSDAGGCVRQVRA